MSLLVCAMSLVAGLLAGLWWTERQRARRRGELRYLTGARPWWGKR